MPDVSTTPWEEFTTTEVEKMARILGILYPVPEAAYPGTFSLTAVTSWVYNSGQRSVVDAATTELRARKRRLESHN